MSAFGERGGFENQVAYAKRRKSGLEVPLVGRMYGENKYLVFAPALWHDILVALCVLFGLYASLRGGYLGSFHVHVYGDFFWDGAVPGGLFTSGAVLLAGLWGAFSNEHMIIDLRSRTYRRMEGIGPGKRVFKGNLNELDALVLTSEQYAHGVGIAAVVFYRLVLYWKGQRHPPLVVEKERQSVSFGSPLNAAAQPMLQRGYRYAQAMGIPYYDNSHLSGRSPVPIV